MIYEVEQFNFVRYHVLAWTFNRI